MTNQPILMNWLECEDEESMIYLSVYDDCAIEIEHVFTDARGNESESQSFILSRRDAEDLAIEINRILDSADWRLHHKVVFMATYEEDV